MINSVSAILPAMSAPGAQSAAAVEHGGFGKVLGDVMQHASLTLEQGEAAALAGVEGRMEVRQAVEHVLAAERTLQAAVAIRDKVVGAYLEISRMQI